MKKLALFGAVVLLSSGPSLAQPGPNPCSGANCRVHVTVTNCTITPDHPKLRVARGQTPATIVWSVSGGSFHKDKGIFVKPKGDPNQQVTELRALGDGTWRMVQKRTPKTQISYGITVLDANGKACTPLDPTVINDP